MFLLLATPSQAERRRQRSEEQRLREQLDADYQEVRAFLASARRPTKRDEELALFAAHGIPAPDSYPTASPKAGGDGGSCACCRGTDEHAHPDHDDEHGPSEQAAESPSSGSEDEEDGSSGDEEAEGTDDAGAAAAAQSEGEGAGEEEEANSADEQEAEAEEEEGEKTKTEMKMSKDKAKEEKEEGEEAEEEQEETCQGEEDDREEEEGKAEQDADEQESESEAGAAEEKAEGAVEQVAEVTQEKDAARAGVAINADAPAKAALPPPAATLTAASARMTTRPAPARAATDDDYDRLVRSLVGQGRLLEHFHPSPPAHAHSPKPRAHSRHARLMHVLLWSLRMGGRRCSRPAARSVTARRHPRKSRRPSASDSRSSRSVHSLWARVNVSA